MFPISPERAYSSRNVPAVFLTTPVTACVGWNSPTRNGVHVTAFERSGSRAALYAASTSTCDFCERPLSSVSPMKIRVPLKRLMKRDGSTIPSVTK